MASDLEVSAKPYATTIESLLEKSSAKGSKRTHEQAAALFNDFWKQLGMDLTDPNKPADDEIRMQSIRFLRDVVLPIDWYAGKIKEALRQRNVYLWWSGALLLFIPIVLAAASAIPKDKISDAPLIVAQLTGVLTGVVALQRLVAATFAQQQRYGAWHKASSDLKKLWYGLQSSWLNRDQAKGWSEQRLILLKELTERVSQGRVIASDEQADFFQKLALPTVDLLDSLVKARADASTIVTGLAPGLTGAATQAGKLLEARQEIAKNDSLIKGYEVEIDAKKAIIQGIADDKDTVKVAAKEALVILQKARDTAVAAKRTSEAQVAALQVV